MPESTALTSQNTSLQNIAFMVWIYFKCSRGSAWKLKQSGIRPEVMLSKSNRRVWASGALPVVLDASTEIKSQKVALISSATSSGFLVDSALANRKSKAALPRECD